MNKLLLFGTVLLVIAIILGIYTIPFTETSLEGKNCISDEDCIVFGESGDCNCGCFNKEYQWESGGECFCAAPTSCKCIDSRCVDVLVEVSLCKGTARCIEGIVTRITDGDTLEVDNVSIRLALIDAPEYNEAGGSEARDFVLSICSIGSEAIVDEDDNQTGGSYGRTVGVVYCDGINLNEELVKSGYATIDERFCEVSEFADEEWTGC